MGVSVVCTLYIHNGKKAPIVLSDKPSQNQIWTEINGNFSFSCTTISNAQQTFYINFQGAPGQKISFDAFIEISRNFFVDISCIVFHGYYKLKKHHTMSFKNE